MMGKKRNIYEHDEDQQHDGRNIYRGDNRLTVAQFRIAELEAEADRVRDAAWNDAIEAAAKEIHKYASEAGWHPSHVTAACTNVRALKRDAATELVLE